MSDVWKHVRRAGAAAMLAGCCGCSWYEAPDLRMSDDVILAEETDEGMVLSFALDATNDNEVALPLKTVRYSLELEGERVFRGERSAEATLRRKGTQRILLPAAIAWRPGEFERPVGEVRYTLRGELKYVTPGEVAALLFDTGVRQPSVGFREEGVIEFGARGP